MFGLPNVLHRDDPSNGAIRIAVTIALPILLLLVVFVQQFMLALDTQTFEEAPISAREDETVERPGIGHFTLDMKATLRHVYFIEHEGYEDEDGERGTGIVDDSSVLEYIDEVAVTRTERLRAAVVAREVGGLSAAKERLAKLGAEVSAGGELAADLHWFQTIYGKGAKDLPVEVRESLVERHGWFAELALLSGEKTDERERSRLLSGYRRLLAFQVGLGLLMTLGAVTGLVLAIIAISKIASGGLVGRFDAPAVGGSVYAESVAIFMLAFAVMVFIQIPFRGAGVAGATFGLALGEVLLWSLALSAFWPLLRGVRWEAFRIDMGLHTGKGVMAEVSVGIAAFLAERPLQWLLNIIVSIFEAAFSPEEEDGAITGTSEFPMFDSPIGSSWFLVWLSAAGSVIWAPVVEELIFRGALYRALHGRLRGPLTVVITAICFAIIHPYGADGMASVFIGGIVFGLLREWRGSIIAAVIAHAL
ncbi:MAG: lysostaphin resistance A-like protein, partial [Phycisphaerales bacterium]